MSKWMVYIQLWFYTLAGNVFYGIVPSAISWAIFDMKYPGFSIKAGTGSTDSYMMGWFMHALIVVVAMALTNSLFNFPLYRSCIYLSRKWKLDPGIVARAVYEYGFNAVEAVTHNKSRADFHKWCSAFAWKLQRFSE